MNKKEDLRVIKTKKALYEGLLQMMKTKTFEEIRVSDICQTSLTNRSTFYDHFADKYELFASLINDLEIELEKKLEELNNIETPKEYYMKMLELLLEHINENISIYSNVIKTNTNSIAYDMFMDTILKDIKKNIQNNNYQGTIPIDIITTFYVSAVINVCLSYIKEPTKYTNDEILKYLNELIPNNIY